MLVKAGLYEVEFDSTGNWGVVSYKGFKLTQLYNCAGKDSIIRYIEKNPNVIVSKDYRKVLDSRQRNS